MKNKEYAPIRWILKDNIKLKDLEKYGYFVSKHDATKIFKRNKRNETVLVHINSDKEIIISYYHNLEFIKIAKYRDRKYLRDLIRDNLIENIK